MRRGGRVIGFAPAGGGGVVAGRLGLMARSRLVGADSVGRSISIQPESATVPRLRGEESRPKSERRTVRSAWPTTSPLGSSSSTLRALCSPVQETERESMRTLPSMESLAAASMRGMSRLPASIGTSTATAMTRSTTVTTEPRSSFLRMPPRRTGRANASVRLRVVMAAP